MNVTQISKFATVDTFQLKASGSRSLAIYSLIGYEEILKFNPLFNWKPMQVL